MGWLVDCSPQWVRAAAGLLQAPLLYALPGVWSGSPTVPCVERGRSLGRAARARVTLGCDVASRTGGVVLGWAVSITQSCKPPG